MKSLNPSVPSFFFFLRGIQQKQTDQLEKLDSYYLAKSLTTKLFLINFTNYPRKVVSVIHKLYPQFIVNRTIENANMINNIKKRKHNKYNLNLAKL